MFSTFSHRLSIHSIIEIFYFSTKYVQSRLLQNCRMRESIIYMRKTVEHIVFQKRTCLYIGKYPVTHRFSKEHFTDSLFASARGKQLTLSFSDLMVIINNNIIRMAFCYTIKHAWITLRPIIR